MNFVDFESDEFKLFSNFHFAVSSKLVNRKVSINGYVAIEISVISNRYQSDEEIDLFLPDGTMLGSLITKPSNNRLDVGKLTEKKYISYLIDVTKEIFLAGDLILNSSYVIIEETRLDEYYTNYYDTATIWGNFAHKYKRYALASKPQNINAIKLVKDLKHPTEIHRASSLKALLEPYCFERFLKKYHQIELLYDLDVVNRIRGLNKDLYGIGSLLSEINSNELNRLRVILKEKMYNFLALSEASFLATSFRTESEAIFQHYSKAGNPIKDADDFGKLFTLPSFNVVDIKAFRSSLVGVKYNEFLLDLISYWIYRIRSSIAHQRIGEYIITEKEEDFVLGFAEPLIDEILVQIYKLRP